MGTQFGDFTLDESRRQLFGKAGEVHLSPKGFQLLSILIAVQPKAISKSELQEQLWPATFVSESNLAGLVAELRAALGDDARDPRFIRTAYGYGYAFAGTMVQPPPITPVAAPEKRRRRFRPLALVALASLLGLASSHSERSLPYANITEARRAAIRSIAILPFKTDRAASADEHLGLGLADVLITRLSKQGKVIVRPTSAIDRYDPQKRDSRAAGRELGVDAVLEGSIRRSGEQVRVTVLLVNVHDGYPMWGDKVDESASEMFALEDSISAKVAKALTLELSRAEWAGLNRQYTRDPAAYAAYLKGRYFVTQQTAAARLKSIDAFQEAVARDPMYALGYAELAHAYSAQGVYQDVAPKDAWPKSEAAAMKALELDPTLSEAHGALGSVRLNWDRNWPAAENELLRALQLDPQNALAQRNYAWLLQSQGRFNEALPARLRAIEVDPLSAAARREAAWTYYLAGRDDESIAQFKAALELDPNFVQAHIGLAKIYARRNQYDQAIESARTAAKIDPTPNALGWLGYAYARAGKRDEARAILDQLLEQSRSRHVGWQHVAVIYIGLGDSDNAFKWLDKGVIDGSNLAFLKFEPAVEPLRSDARYKPLIRRAGFEP